MLISWRVSFPWILYGLGLYPGRLTWNLQITHLERKMIFQASMIMFHVNLPGCNSHESSWVRLKNKNPALQGFAASLTAASSALQHGSGGVTATDAMHATSEYLASGIGALTVWDAQGKGRKTRRISQNFQVNWICVSWGGWKNQQLFPKWWWIPW